MKLGRIYVDCRRQRNVVHFIVITLAILLDHSVWWRSYFFFVAIFEQNITFSIVIVIIIKMNLLHSDLFERRLCRSEIEKGQQLWTL